MKYHLRHKIFRRIDKYIRSAPYSACLHFLLIKIGIKLFEPKSVVTVLSHAVTSLTFCAWRANSEVSSFFSLNEGRMNIEVVIEKFEFKSGFVTCALRYALASHLEPKTDMRTPPIRSIFYFKLD